MKFLFIPLLLGVALNGFAQTSYVPFAKILPHKGYQIGITGDYFSTTKQADYKGNVTELDPGDSFSRVQSEFFGAYGLTSNLQVGLGTRLRQNMSSSAYDETKTSSGVESTYLTLMYAFNPVERTQYSLEGLFRFRPYTNQESEFGNSSEQLVLGDDGNEYSAGLNATWSSKSNNHLNTKIGYRKSGSLISPEIYWQIEAALAWNYLALMTGIEGFNSLDENRHSNRSYNYGVTRLYNSYNRELFAPYAGLNLALGQFWRLEMKATLLNSGKSTDLGSAYSISLFKRSSDKKSNSFDKAFKSYDFESAIVKVSPRKGYVVIDKGISSDVQKGMKIDFYEFDYIGGNILLATGIVYETRSDSSIVKVTYVYNAKKELKEGVLARGSFR